MDTEGLELWVEASSCSCERVFSFVTASDCGQSTLQMCETLWVRCNGVAVEDWCPTNIFEKLRTTQFCPRIKRKRALNEDVGNCSLLLFEAYKDLDIQVSSDSAVPLTEDIQNLWAVCSRPSTDTTDTAVSEIMAVYGVEGDPDSDGEEEIVDFPTIPYRCWQQYL